MKNPSIILFFFFCFFTFSLFSCSSKETENLDIISDTDFFPQTENDYDYSEDELIDSIHFTNPLRKKLESSNSSINFLLPNKFNENSSTFLPNRFDYLNKQEEYFSIDDVSFHLIVWDFEDSTNTINAFYNWIDCFGNKCVSLALNEEKKMSTDAFTIWVDEKSLSLLESTNKIDIPYWSTLLLDAQVKPYFILSQAPNKPTKWQSF